jgi:hypothetical protein
VKLTDSNGGENHLIPFSNGGLSPTHVGKIGPAVWLFLLLEDLVTAGDGADGLVFGGKPVMDSRLATRLGVHRKTIAVWRRRLTAHGYVSSKPTPAGNVLWVRRSKKWLWLKANANKAQAREVGLKSLPVGAEPLPGGSQMAPKWERKREGKSDVARRSKDVGAAPALKEAWKVLGVTSPIGNVLFQGEWEAWWAEHGANSKLLSQVAEDFLQHRQRSGQRTPRDFFDAKHRLEEIERAPAIQVSEIPVLKGEPWAN